MTERGKYIVIEGNDGTGKSEQVRLLGSSLIEHGTDVVIVEEPGSEDPEKSTPFANYLRSIIKNGNLRRDPEVNLALFSAARSELWFNKIAPALGKGATVLSARNYFSTLAYQGKGEGLNLETIIKTTELATDSRYMHPDHMIILTLNDESVRSSRIAGRGILETPDTFESMDSSFQNRVNRAYIDLATEYSIATINGIDKSGHAKTRSEIQKEIWDLIFSDQQS